MMRHIITPAIWIAVGLSPMSLPRAVSAQQAQTDSSQLEEIKGHSRKIIRPGAGEKPNLVWRAHATEATLLALAGAFVLALPVAGVYEFTNRKRTTLDRGVTQSILLLPPIVAGIVAVVQNSLALAFSLAGVATTVRFRSSLKDTNDAAYIFLAIAIGIAAGAEALDVATVVSLGACGIALLVFGLSGLVRPKPVPVAPPSPPSSPASPAPAAEDDRSTAIMVSTPHDEHARSAVESLLDGLTKQWRLDAMENSSLKEEVRLRYLVRTKKRLDADALVSAINAAGASQGIHAELDHQPQAAPAPPADDDEAPEAPETPEPATRS
jgi:hypothetical protein